ncbi:MAG: hypothetical protein ACI9LY_001442 [Arenicella sp.]|jgi:hypothetical protein
MEFFHKSKVSLSSFGASLILSGFVGISTAHAADSGSTISAAELRQNGYQYPTDLVSGANHTQFSNYAWRLFIASMQNTTATLQNGASRTNPSSSSNFITSGSTTTYSNPLVFESFYHRTEAFPYYATAGEKPASPIGQVPAYYTYYRDENEDTVAYTVKGQQYVNLDETNQIGQNFLYYRESNDPDFPVLFMAKVNTQETKYVWDKKKPSANDSFVFPNNVVEVKSAWRRVQDIKNSNPNQYHQASATYYVTNTQGVPHPVTEKFALIAIHIIQKTANYQEFIFTTFEHVDTTTRLFKQQSFGFNACPVQFGELVENTSEAEMVEKAYAAGANGFTFQSQLKYGKLMIGDYPFPCESQANLSWPIYLKDASTILDPAYQTAYDGLAYNPSGAHTASFTGAYTINEPGQPNQNNGVTNNHALPKEGTVSVTDFNVITQPKTITAEVNAVNNQVASLITSLDANSVWANYRLKGVQAVPTNNQLANDYYLANIVVESSQPGIQLFTGTLVNAGTPVPTPPTYPVGLLTNNRSIDGSYSDFGSYANVSIGLIEGKRVPKPQYTVGGCQGCHGAAQQVGRDFSFLSQAVAGNGKELDSVHSPAHTAAEATAHKAKMALTNNAQ